MIVSPFRVVIDANVLFQASVRDTLLRAAQAGLFQLYWSVMILDELERSLIESGRMTPAKTARLRAHLESEFSEAMTAGYEPFIDAMPNHEKDRHVAAAALKASAQVIVTNNLKDFAALPDHIEAQSADAFLSNLFELDPPVLLQVLSEQAAALTRPAVSLEKLLTHMRGLVPEFIDQVTAARGHGGLSLPFE